jgi:large subunit ribosomal protein L14
MIRQETRLDVADNTGATQLSVIRVIGGSVAKVGMIVICSVKSAQPKSSVSKGDVVRAVVVRQAANILRPNGLYVSFRGNSAVIVDKNGNPRGTRIFGPIAKELRDGGGFSKIVSLAPELV